MKLIATREVDLSEVAPDQGITHEGKRYVVDEVRRTRDGFVLSCISEENPAVSRRKTFTFASDDKIVVEASEVDRRALLRSLNAKLEGKGDSLEFTLMAGTGGEITSLTITLGLWTVVLEA